MTTSFYPSLATLIPLESLPSELGFLSGGLSNFFDHFFYRDLQVHKSVNGDAAFYSLKLLTYKRLALEIPGTSGLALILNPSLDEGVQGASSEFPISLSYQWGILRYAKAFDLQSFDWSPAAFFDLILNLTGATKQELLTEALRVLTDDPDPIQQFIDLFNNSSNNPAAPLVLNSFPTEEEVIEDLLTQLVSNNNDFDAYQIILEQYIVSLNSLDEIFDKLKLLFAKWLGVFSIDQIKELLTPRFFASIDALSLGIQFPSNILREVDALGKPVPYPNHPEGKPAMLSFSVASLNYSTADGLEFKLANSLNINFPRSEILRSGLILELHDVKVDFSRTTNIPEAIADGRPADFVGVYVKDGTITFPAFWQHNDANSTGVIKARNLLIGTGGFSGTLGLEKKVGVTSAALLECKFGKDFSVSLDKFSITLKQNAIKESEIEGTLVIPGLKDALNNPAQIKIKVAIRQNGDFDITGHEDDGFKTFKCGSIFELTLKTVFVGKEGDDFYLGVGGSIKFTHSLISQFVKDKIEIEKLIIWSDGRLEIKGGTIPLPKNIRFPIGPAEISITAIHLGSHQRIDSNGSIKNFRYFGFDGGVDINPGGVDVRGKGIKFFYPEDLNPSECYLEIKSIAIDLVIPGSASKETATLLISGFLSIDGTQADPQYSGGISFALPKAKIAGGASMMLRPKVPAFIVDAFVELSTPIPLGSTSLGIYGFRGLFGQRYVATKAAAGLTNESDTWFDYYKKPQPTQGVNISKFEGPSLTKSYDGAFSIGAGVSLATAQDDGKTFSCKLFLLLSLPDLIYLEGKANILGERVGLDGADPPFFAMLAISSKSVETGVGVNYKLPRDGSQPGWIVDLNAEMRAAFFFQNSSAWYVNFGTIQNPTSARVLTIFDAYSYVMLSAAGIAAGAGVSFGFDKSYAGGMVRASVGVYIKVGGFISFERPQIGGFAMLGGHVDVSLMWFSFYLVIDTSLSVEVPKPFYIQGSVHLCVGVTIGFWKFKKQIEKCFDVEFKWEKDPTKDTSPVLPFADLITNPNALAPAMGTNMLSGESFKVAYVGTSLPPASLAKFDTAVLPLDSWVDIEFLKGLLPGSNVDARIGRLSGQAPANTIDYVPPAEVAHKVKHEYAIKAVEIKAWNGSAWVDYRPYEAMSPPDALPVLNTNPSAFKDGFWQNTGSGFNKLRLLAETSLSYMQQGQPGWYIPEQFGITSASLFCQTKLREMHCLNWIDVAAGTVYAAEAWRQIETVLFRVSNGPGNVIDWNSHFGISRSLAFPNEATAQIVFNQPCVEVNLKLTTFSSGAVIRFYKRETVGAGFVYTLVETRTLTQLQLLAPVQYHDASQPVAKVEIDPIKADAAAIYALQIQLDALNRQLNETKLNPRQTGALTTKIATLEKELERLKAQECRPKGIDHETAGEIPKLESQVKECGAQLNNLVAEQEKVCARETEFHALFEHCFPRQPSMLSYEFVKTTGTERRSRFQFLVYDDLSDSLLLKGAQNFPNVAAVEKAVHETLRLALRPEAYVLTKPRTGRYSFQIVDAAGVVKADSAATFKTVRERNAFLTQAQEKFRRARTDEEFVLAPRQGGKLPCDESLDHLTCWKQLPTLGSAGAGKCDSIMAGILSAREAFCREYNKLYRELYLCNKKLLDELTLQCETLTHEVEIKHKECEALSEQLAALLELQNFIDQNGALTPPKDFPCVTLLHEACCLSLEDYHFNLSAPGKAAIDQDYQTAVDAIQNWLTPIWRPDTKYCVRLQVTDTVDDSQSQDTEFYFGFRTAGPVGFFHTDSFANYIASDKSADQYMLTGLKGYIDYRRSYPDPSGQLIGSKPLFYEDARLLLFFTKRYVYHFFGDWPAYNALPAITGSALQIIIKDPSENTSIANPPPPDIITTEIPQAVTTWPSDDDPRIPEDIRTLLNLHNPELLNDDFEGGDCWSSGGEMIKPASVYTSVTPKYLKPLKLYTAIVNNVYLGQVREVHQYGFQTSRYPDFVAQVKSYQLDDGNGFQRDAVFRIDVPLSVADLDLMYAVVSRDMSAPANQALAGTWADPFDRLVAGVMKLKPLDAAISTEFNIVVNSTTDAAVAVWIRNPEPFNDPKLPDDVLERTLRVMDGLNTDLDYRILFSKDGSQAFVMHPAKVIPLAQMRFRFAYIEWDGNAYVDHAVVMSDVINTQG